MLWILMSPQPWGSAAGGVMWGHGRWHSNDIWGDSAQYVCILTISLQCNFYSVCIQCFWLLITSIQLCHQPLGCTFNMIWRQFKGVLYDCVWNRNAFHRPMQCILSHQFVLISKYVTIKKKKYLSSRSMSLIWHGLSLRVVHGELMNLNTFLSAMFLKYEC